MTRQRVHESIAERLSLKQHALHAELATPTKQAPSVYKWTSKRENKAIILKKHFNPIL